MTISTSGWILTRRSSELASLGNKAFALFVGDNPDRNIGEYDQSRSDHKPHLLAAPIASPSFPCAEQQQDGGKHSDGQNGIEH